VYKGDLVGKCPSNWLPERSKVQCLKGNLAWRGMHAVTCQLCSLACAARMHQGIVLKTPKAYTSAAGDILPPARSSGAICVTVPATSSVARLSWGCAWLSGISLLRPKSDTLTVKPRQPSCRPI